MSRDSLEAGIYLVATPIGNLEDLGGRASRVLRLADVVACEDTRHSAPLLQACGAQGRRVALHEHNEDRVSHDLVAEVRAGKSVAVISDAGTPLISDPGYPLIRHAVESGVRVFPIPGPSSVLAALSASGLPAARFHFLGFLPERASRRQALLKEVGDLDATLVLFSPARDLAETLAELRAVLGNRQAAVCRELTKIHEEIRRGTLEELRQAPLTTLGEAVVVVAGAPEAVLDEAALERAIDQGLADRISPSALAKGLAREHGVPRSQVYERILKRRRGAAGQT